MELSKVLHIAPIGWHGLIGGDRLKGFSDQILLTYSFRTEGKYVVALLTDPNSEFQGFDS